MSRRNYVTGAMLILCLLLAVEMRLSFLLAVAAPMTMVNECAISIRTVTETTASPRTRRATIVPLTELTGNPTEGSLNCTLPFTTVYDRVVVTEQQQGQQTSSAYLGGQKIPRIVHLSMTSRCLHELTAIGVQKWKDALPNYSVFFHDDQAVDRLLEQDWPEFPHLRKVMNCIKFKGAMKIDVWRILVVYRYGGIYADIDVWPGRDFTEKTIEPQDEAFFLSDADSRPSQWFFAMEPGHPIAHFTMLEILNRIVTIPDISQPKVVDITGPKALRDGYMRALNWRAGILLEGVFVGKFNRTARKIGKRATQKFEYVSGNIDARVAWNATTTISVREKLELDTGQKHWKRDILKNHGSVRGGDCMELLYEMDQHFTADHTPA